MLWQALQDKMRRLDFCDLSEQYSFHPRVLLLRFLLRMGPWSAGSAWMLSCTTSLLVVVGEDIEKGRGEGRWTWLLPVGQCPPSINTCWLHLPVLSDRSSFERDNTAFYQGLPQLHISVILCLLCRVVHSFLSLSNLQPVCQAPHTLILSGWGK